MFQQLISVSGIGASTARVMLSYMKPDELARAIVQGDIRTLEGIKGIGKKTAERMVLELRDKLAKTTTGIKYFPYEKQYFATGCVKCFNGFGHQPAGGRTGTPKNLEYQPRSTG